MGHTCVQGRGLAGSLGLGVLPPRFGVHLGHARRLVWRSSTNISFGALCHFRVHSFVHADLAHVPRGHFRHSARIVPNSKVAFL